MRTVAAIDLEIDAVNVEFARVCTMLDNLRAERAASLKAQRAGIVADFDAGHRRRVIAASWGVSYQHVTNVLHIAGRNERQRTEARLDPRSRPHYDKLVRNGMGPAAARKAAEALVAP